MNTYIVVILLTTFYICCGRDIPVWSDRYNLNVTVLLPTGEVEEPIQIWRDTTNNRMRFDYYNGTVKEYIFTRNKVFKIVPTSDGHLNILQCFKILKDDRPRLGLLPNLRTYNYEGNEFLDGYETEKWSNVYSTMWVRYIEDGIKKVAVPVRYRYLWVDQKQYLIYNNYRPEISSDDIFDLPDMKCQILRDTYIENNNNDVTFSKRESLFLRTQLDIEFTKFMEKYKRTYASEEEYIMRKEIFGRNLQLIQSTNRENLSYTLAVNYLADRTEEELTAFRGYRPSKNVHNTSYIKYEPNEKVTEDLPEELDWRLYGAVTRVKDQLQCSSCWAFATTGVLEGAYFVQKNKSFSLSEQALIDCSWNVGNFGCQGGWIAETLEWVKNYGGLPVEDDYPYLNIEGSCHINNTTLEGISIKNVIIVASNENALKSALFKYGPVGVSIQAIASFSFYSNGVYSDPKCNGKHINHAVLVVGYGTLNGEPYWLVKNSGSEYWGNGGYILMSRKNNICGIYKQPVAIEV